MRTETILGRPFFRLADTSALTAWVDTISVRFAEHEDFSPGPAIPVARPATDCQLSLSLPPALAAEMAHPIALSDLVLAVVLKDNSKRVTGVLHRWTALEDLSEELRVPTHNHKVGWSGPKGATLSVYLACHRRLDRVIGLPWHPGHILAMKHFGINRAAPGADFNVTFQDPSFFAGQQLPQDTMVIFRADSDDLRLQPDEGPNFEVIVNSRLRPVLNHTERTNPGKLLTSAIKTSAVSQLLGLALLESDLPDGSIGSRFLQRVRRQCGPHCLDGAAQDPNCVPAVAQAFAGILEAAESLR